MIIHFGHLMRPYFRRLFLLSSSCLLVPRYKRLFGAGFGVECHGPLALHTPPVGWNKKGGGEGGEGGVGYLCGKANDQVGEATSFAAL
ncbi:hypothetical protein GQ53DRAFT_154062 [Thozetella sp. PMI_491]|nr:hypothetical protein GQ53DRAFT_154062 [Thozetella sp. PMI_491]